MAIKEIKNFMPDNILKNITDTITSDTFPWYYNPFVAFKGENSQNIYFTHILYNNDNVNSSYFKDMALPFIDKLKVKKLIKIKLNLYPYSEKLIKHNWHVDAPFKHTVALYYINTNNGFTFMKNPDTKIKSEANKCVIFDGHHEHRSTTCTDQQCRLTLNIDYE